MKILKRHDIKANVVAIVILLLMVFTFQLSFAQEQIVSGADTKLIAATGRILTIEINPSGAGSVTKIPDKSSYDQSEYVTLRANANGNYSFMHWSGDVDRYSRNPLNIYMEEDRTIVANFVTDEEEFIKTPTTPAGPEIAQTGAEVTFSSGGATSNLGHDVEYQFDWGDSSGYSAWSSSTDVSHNYSSAGTYQVKTQARCASDTSVVSSWSSAKSVLIEASSFSGLVTLGPNPVRSDGCIFWFGLPEGVSQAKLMLFNIMGRLVFETPIEVGVSRFPSTGSWNPVDQDGIPLANGPYIYILIGDEKVLAQGKMVIQR